MKIALITPGGVDRSGTERVIPCLLWLIERLASTGHDVHVFALRQEPRTGRWKLLGAEVHSAGGPLASASLLRMLWSEHRRGRFDVIHAFWAIPSGVLAAIAAPLLRIPIVLTLPGGDMASLPAIGYGSRRRLHNRLRLGVAMSAAHKITVPSEPMQARARELGFDAEHIPLGVALDRWPAAEPRRRDISKPLRLLHVASLNRVKDQATLLRACAELERRGIDFEIAIVGGDTLSGEVQALAQQLRLSNVRFAGLVPHAQLRPWFGRADLLVVSSRHEGAPIVLLEAAVAGVPTIGTAVGHVAEYSPDASIAVPVADSVALADAIARVAADEDLRLALATNAQRRAIAENADLTARLFENAYAAAGAERPATQPASIEQRLARAGGAIPLDWLWPDVPPAEWQQSVRAIAGATKDVLAGKQAMLSGRAEALSVAGYTSGMGPLLGWWIDKGDLCADAAVADLFRKHLEHNRIRNRRMTDAAAGLLKQFESAGIDVTLIKGIHTSAAYFPDPATRPMSDIDFVVAPDSFERAERLLSQHGYVEAGPLVPRPTRRAWKPADAPPHVLSLSFVHADDPWTIDLQSSLDRWFASKRVARLQELGGLTEAASPPFERTARVLKQPALALELAAHASHRLSSLNLLRMVELVLVLRRDFGSRATSWQQLLAAAREADLQGFVYPAFHFAEQLAPGTIPAEILSECEAAAPAAVRRVVARYDIATVHRVGRRSISEAFMWCDGWSGRAHQAWRWLLPSSSPDPKHMGIADFARWRARSVLGRQRDERHCRL